MSITSATAKFLKLQESDSCDPIMAVGDEMGYVHRWNLKKILDELKGKGFKEVQSIAKNKLSFNPTKNAMINQMN